MLSRDQIRLIVDEHGHDILEHEHMRVERRSFQHGVITTYAHSIRVACLAVWFADRLHLWRRVDRRSLVRAALLHDYFLYDWHDWDDGAHRWHGFTHGGVALRNALRDFQLNAVERDAIRHHMFPLTPVPPRHIVGWLVTLADKVSATRETLSRSRFDKPRVAAAMAAEARLGDAGAADEGCADAQGESEQITSAPAQGASEQVATVQIAPASAQIMPAQAAIAPTQAAAAQPASARSSASKSTTQPAPVRSSASKSAAQPASARAAIAPAQPAPAPRGEAAR